MSNDKRYGESPAAIAAALARDLDNAFIAMMPGGIEAQETVGQLTLVTSELLPKKMQGCTRENLESLGIQFCADANADDLFVTAKLPPGWKKEATDHSLWSNLIDAKGRVRAKIFYKAAFYDRSAHMYLCERYYYSMYERGSDDDHNRCVITDQNQTIHVVGEYACVSSLETSERLRAEARAWLTKHFPEWENPIAYWD